MANSPRVVTAILGVDFDARDTTPQFPLGCLAHYVLSTGQGGKCMYVQANGAIAASQSDILVSNVGQASDGTGTWSNTAVAFADNEYGWVYLVDNT